MMIGIWFEHSGHCCSCAVSWYVVKWMWHMCGVAGPCAYCWCCAAVLGKYLLVLHVVAQVYTIAHMPYLVLCAFIGVMTVLSYLCTSLVSSVYWPPYCAHHAVSPYFNYISCVTVLALIIWTAKNNNYYDCSALNRKQLNYARVAFEYLERFCHLYLRRRWSDS